MVLTLERGSDQKSRHIGLGLWPDPMAPSRSLSLLPSRLILLVSPTRASSFFQSRKKEPKTLAPLFGPAAPDSFAPSPLRGAGTDGPSLAQPCLSPHPCGSPLCTTSPLSRTKGASGRALSICRLERPLRGTGSTADHPATRSQPPYRRPRAGVAQGVSGMDAAKGGVGPWMVHLHRPPEQRRSEGSQAAWRPDPDVGVPFFFGYFLVGQATRK